MRLAKIAVVALATGFVAVSSAGSAFAETAWDANHPRRDEVNDRLRNQDHRINQERREGEISRGQARQLHREDHQPVVEDPFDWVLHDGKVVHSALHLLLTSRAGHIIPISYSAAPIRDATGHITGGVLVFRDESERRRNEQALRNADRQKDEFLATLAHELRNPLAPICMGLDLLRMSEHDRAANSEVFDMMARQSRHMVRLIDDLMDVSRITRGKLELRKQQIALDEVLQNAVDANRPNIDQARLRLTLHLPAEPILLFADPNRLTQVFSNLLNNAAKFTPAEATPGAPASASCTVAAQLAHVMPSIGSTIRALLMRGAMELVR